MKRKSLIFPFLLALFLSLTGCNKNQQSGGDIPKREDRIVLNASRVQLNLNDTFQLEISYSNVDASEITTFASSNSDIVTVDDTGFVIAVGQGKASVEVNKGEAKAECAFTVSLADEIPYIDIESISNNHLELDITTDYELNPVARFGNKNFEIENLAFTVIAGTGNGEMRGNVFHPTQKGDLSIKISGEYDGNTMHNYYLSVLVKESVLFTLREEGGGTREFGSVNLYTLASYGGHDYVTTFKPLPSVLVDGVDKSSELTFDIIDPNNILNYDTSANIITAVSAGIATFRMHYQTYTKDFMFYVNYIFDECAVEDIVIDASVGEFPNETIFANFPGNSQIIKATSVDKTVEYDVVNGKVLGIPSHNFIDQQIIVYNNKVGLIIDFKAYAKIIRQPEDLTEFYIDVPNADAIDRFKNDGYYILANDLDCSGITYPNSTRVLGRGASSLEPACGFVGTFDGQGHTIKNFKTPSGGLFLVLGQGSIVKNVAFVDAILDVATLNDRFVLATYCYGTSISNVFINSSSDLGQILNNALVAGCIGSTSSLTNCVFEYTGNATRDKAQGSFTHLNELGNPQFTDTYVVSRTVMTLADGYYADTRQYTDTETIKYSRKAFRLYTGVKHYLDYAEMQGDQLDYSSFSSQYWDISSGVPVWKQ